MIDSSLKRYFLIYIFACEFPSKKFFEIFGKNFLTMTPALFTFVVNLERKIMLSNGFSTIRANYFWGFWYWRQRVHGGTCPFEAQID
jgi:hypothetical protein